MGRPSRGGDTCPPSCHRSDVETGPEEGEVLCEWAIEWEGKCLGRGCEVQSRSIMRKVVSVFWWGHICVMTSCAFLVVVGSGGLNDISEQ